MNWFNFFKTPITKKKHSFGRGINADISKNEEELFNQAYEAFEKKDILNAYEYFLKSLENYSDGESNNNITITREDKKLTFEIFQGTARISCYITKEYLFAESIMIKKSDAHVAFKRYILERNYQLTYAYYYSDDSYIKLKLYHDNTTMSPHKAFFPLRELALNADFDKEYTKNEFHDIPLEDISHLEPIEEKELRVKYDYMHQWIEELNFKIATLPSNDNAGMQAFIYLCLLFKIDYLLVPRYEMYQKMSKKVTEYFGDENNTTEAKNDELKVYVDELKEMSFEDFSTKFYDAKYTFNPSDRSAYEEINNFINDSLAKIRWYKNNRYNQVIPTIYEYISFNILYSYGVHPAIKELLQIPIEILNPDFFKAFEYPTLYNTKEKTFAKKIIISKIEEIIEPYKKRFKSLEPFGAELNFSSINEFNNSFYLQISNLNFEDVQS